MKFGVKVKYSVSPDSVYFLVLKNDFEEKLVLQNPSNNFNFSKLALAILVKG